MPTRPPKDKYFQITGRPHIGLDDPKKFGLTFEEVVRLIDTNEWRPFYKRWLRKQKLLLIIEDRNYICPTCKQKKFNPDEWKFDGSECKQCIELRKSERIVASMSIAPRKEENEKPLRETCSGCKKRRVLKFSVQGLSLCNDCFKRLRCT